MNPIIDFAPTCKHNNPKAIPTTWKHDIIHEQIGEEGGIKEQPNTTFLESECIVKEIDMLFVFFLKFYFSKVNCVFVINNDKAFLANRHESSSKPKEIYEQHACVWHNKLAPKKKTLGMKIVICCTCFQSHNFF